MDKHEFLGMTADKQMWYWITEREIVRTLKEIKDPKPWTHDRIFRTTRFTNVRREDDRVTRWVRDNWRNEYVDHPDLVSMLIFARMVNRPETLAEMDVLPAWDSEYYYYALKNRVSRGLVTWGNAYMITTCGKRMEKERYVVEVAEQAAGILPENAWLKSWFQRINQIDGMGTFLTAQVIADLKNIPQHPLNSAPDFATWCASGPGSRRGINYYFGLPPETAQSEAVFQRRIAVAWTEVEPLLPAKLKDLHMQDFQNCFCEYSKYRRILDGGRAKNGYLG